MRSCRGAVVGFGVYNASASRCHDSGRPYSQKMLLLSDRDVTTRISCSFEIHFCVADVRVGMFSLVTKEAPKQPQMVSARVGLH